MPPICPGAWAKRVGIEQLYPDAPQAALVTTMTVSDTWTAWTSLVNPLPADFIPCGLYASFLFQPQPQLAYAHVYSQLGVGPDAANVTPLPGVTSYAASSILPPFTAAGAYLQPGDYFPVSPQLVASGAGLWLRAAINVHLGTFTAVLFAAYVAGYPAAAVPEPYTPLRNDLRYQAYYNGTSRKFPPGLGVNTFTFLQNTWYQLSASLPNDIVIQGFSITPNPTFIFDDHLELGSGSPGSEVARCRMGTLSTASFLGSSAGRPVWPQVFLAGERLVVRRTKRSLQSAIIVTYEDLPGP